MSAVPFDLRYCRLELRSKYEIKKGEGSHQNNLLQWESTSSWWDFPCRFGDSRPPQHFLLFFCFVALFFFFHYIWFFSWSLIFRHYFRLFFASFVLSFFSRNFLFSLLSQSYRVSVARLFFLSLELSSKLLPPWKTGLVKTFPQAQFLFSSPFFSALLLFEGILLCQKSSPLWCYKTHALCPKPSARTN